MIIEKLNKYRDRVIPRFSEYLNQAGHRRWVIGGIALFATGTIAAIQQDPGITALQHDIVMAVPQEIIHVPAPQGGMRRLSESETNFASYSGLIQDDEIPAFNWQILTIGRGDTLAALLGARGLYSHQVRKAVTENASSHNLRNLRVGRTLRLGVDAQGRLNELIYEVNNNATVLMQRATDGSYSSKQVARLYETRQSYASTTIEDSLYQAGKKAGLSDRLVMDIAGIFGWDIDFARDLQRGDHVTAIYEEKYWRGEKIGSGRIVAAEFINRGRILRAIGIRDERGRLHYYTPGGKSMQRQFLKNPVRFTHISSRFSKGRYHPILKRWRAHKGVDYAARRGTPVRATATGRILERGRKGGYGKTVVIRHGGKYATLYAHLSRYRRGLRPGSLVKQGDIIGYVGSSGLATGPHLHYEFRVYGKHRNPLTVRVSRTRPLGENLVAEFSRSAQRFSEKLDRINDRVRLASNIR
jgi:murein DD-endopeptidase MepM/ murein hydrolase activator NlpD